MPEWMVSHGQTSYSARARVAGRPPVRHERPHALAQRVRRQAAFNPPLERERNLAGLFRHDDRHGVSFLGQADGGPVPRAQLAADARVHGERKETGRRRDAVLLEDHRAVVKRRPRVEDRDEQVVGETRIQRNAALDVVPQPDFALDGDDRSHALRRQHGRGHDDLFDPLVGRLLAVEIPEERRLAEMRQRAADIGLEDHDRRKCHVHQHVADHPVHRLERRQPRDVEQADDEERAHRHLDGAGPPDQFQELVDQDGDDRDVQQIPPPDRRAAQQAGEVLGHL